MDEQWIAMQSNIDDPITCYSVIGTPTTTTALCGLTGITDYLSFHCFYDYVYIYIMIVLVSFQTIIDVHIDRLLDMLYVSYYCLKQLNFHITSGSAPRLRYQQQRMQEEMVSPSIR